MDFYRLAELAELTGVTPRTIRYYIVEGLLSPPQGAGPAAVYTAAHRDRLRLIAALKARYVPLREIRRRLAALTDAQVRAELRDQGAAQRPAADGTSPGTNAEPATPRAPSRPDPPRQAPRPPGDAPPVAVPGVATVPPRERWERIVLADGIELHVREDRCQERILLDALVRQARKLLGEP